MNYFTIDEADQFTFFRIPKTLFSDKKYKYMSTDAKVLYGILLDRVGLSKKNNWVDDKNRIFIIFTRKEAQELLNCSKPKIVKLFKELCVIGLIEERKQGVKKANIIYVKHFISGNSDTPEDKQNKLTPTPKNQKFESKFNISIISENETKNEGKMEEKYKLYDKNVTRFNNFTTEDTRLNNFTSQGKKTLPTEVKKLYPNDTDKNDTNYNDIDICAQNQSLSVSQSSCTTNLNDGRDRMTKDNINFVEDYFKKKIKYEDGLLKYPEQKKLIDEILVNITQMYFSRYVKINNVLQTQDMIRYVIEKLTHEHLIELVDKCMNLTYRITNAKAYMQSMIFNTALEFECKFKSNFYTQVVDTTTSCNQLDNYFDELFQGGFNNAN